MIPSLPIESTLHPRDIMRAFYLLTTKLTLDENSQVMKELKLIQKYNKY